MKSEASPLCAVTPVVPPLLLSLLASIDIDALDLGPSKPTRHRSATMATALHISSALPLHDDLPSIHTRTVSLRL